MTAGVYEGGMVMAGTGQMIGDSVLILYNDPAAHSVLSLGQTDRRTDRRTPDRADIVQRPRCTQRPVTRLQLQAEPAQRLDHTRILLPSASVPASATDTLRCTVLYRDEIAV